ncbi:MAG: hypothetical protein AAF989_15900 [Planctomycetota bacterium]
MRKTILAFLAMIALHPFSVLAEELTDEKYSELLEEVRPKNDEPWRTIPWKIDLLNAQQTSVREAKPLFIWAMDGHPLGCT